MDCAFQKLAKEYDDRQGKLIKVIYIVMMIQLETLSDIYLTLHAYTIAKKGT
jgi:hypothetical protein